MTATMTVPPTGPPTRLSSLNKSVTAAVLVRATADSHAWSRPVTGGRARSARMTTANVAAASSRQHAAMSAGRRRTARGWPGAGSDVFVLTLVIRTRLPGKLGGKRSG